MSAIARIIDEDIFVLATLFLYGTKASEEIAIDIENEINRMWNQPLVVFPIADKYYKVKFQIVCKVIEINDARQMIVSNTSHENNFIRIEETNTIGRSMMGFGLGQNSGFWVTSDNLGHSTTAAHEFGHSLGLPHPENIDFRGIGYPPLMAPRGTIVDSEFQWNPLADAGTYGGTMKPVYRRVTQQEVLMVAGKMIPVLKDNFIIGEISNLYFNQKGEAQKISIV